MKQKHTFTDPYLRKRQVFNLALVFLSFKSFETRNQFILNTVEANTTKNSHNINTCSCQGHNEKYTFTSRSKGQPPPHQRATCQHAQHPQRGGVQSGCRTTWRFSRNLRWPLCDHRFDVGLATSALGLVDVGDHGPLVVDVDDAFARILRDVTAS